LPEYEEEEVRVNLEAIARVGKQGYSVPARWAGRRLRARISETKIAFYNGTDRVVEVERHRGSQGVYVDWRHVLPQLLRKPWPSNTVWKGSRRKSCASVWPMPGST
jgi:hypothetical protein